MAHERRFRFGIQLTRPLDGRSWSASAQHLESLGYSTLFVPDHFGDQLAPVAALSVAAEATTTLKVGALVFGNDYRHPVTLATEMATLDLLSSGRVEVGLGAGWMASDYEQAGLAYDRPGVRVDRMDEAIDVLRAMFRGQAFDHHGEHYRISGLTGRPLPHTPGGPPVIVGGGGRRVLGIAARKADIVGVNPNLSAGVIGPEAALDALAPAVDQKVAWVREAAGDRFDDIELNMLAFVASVTDDPGSTARGLAEMFGTDPDSIRAAPAVVLGTVEEICDLLAARRERWGFSYYVFNGDVADLMAPVVARLTGT